MLIAFGAVGLFIGVLIAGRLNALPLGPRTQIIPAAYRLPKIPGGTPLRLAMVHDILHERYLRHGSAWYAQRNLDARKIIASEQPQPAQNLRCDTSTRLTISQLVWNAPAN